MTRWPPGATVGVLGGGQLGRMLALEARRMGYRIVAQDPQEDCCARPIVDGFVHGRLGDTDAALEVARQADVVTLETEHVASEALFEVEKVAPLRPNAQALRTVQDRLRQKAFLADHNLPTAPFAGVASMDELDVAVRDVGTPALFKSRRGGYDGKGQSRVDAPEDALAAWERLGRTPCVLEAFVPFEREISVVLARAADGDVAYYPVAENVHVDGILHTTLAPAPVSKTVAHEARRIARAVAEGLDHVGVLAVEMFVLPGGEVWVNEIAPRVHNSGHYTFGACPTSQFEQHLRAILGLGLGRTDLPQPAVVLNLLGDLWQDGEPDWHAVLDEPTAHLHLYGKHPVKPGRKMGHVLVVDGEAGRALATAQRLFAALGGRPRRDAAPAASRAAPS